MPIRVGVLIIFLNELLKPYLQLRFWTDDHCLFFCKQCSQKAGKSAAATKKGSVNQSYTYSKEVKVVWFGQSGKPNQTIAAKAVF